MSSFIIQCPKCNWQPPRSINWTCTCGHSWYTFDTGGKCPSCNKQWQYTQCQSFIVGGCQQWSPHLDWYTNLDDMLNEELEDIKNVLSEVETV